MSSNQKEPWDQFWEKAIKFKSVLNNSKTINVNEKSTKLLGADLVQNYFRETRPGLKNLNLSEEKLNVMDDLIQKLLTLCNANNNRNSYKTLIKEILSRKNEIEISKEKSFSHLAELKPVGLNQTEQRILKTLQQVVPSAGLSYEQACCDLQDNTRISFRGVASEFRECLREVLDHLAPDNDVLAQKGFKLEDGQKQPTMKQKVKFILRARGLAKNAIDVPEASLDRVNEALAKLARSVYVRTSISTHLATSRAEVTQIKMYAESVLSELLEIHRD